MEKVVSITSGTRSITSREIQVSGNESFDASEWKEALNYYLHGVRHNIEEVMYRPKIFFGNFTLRRMNNGYAVEGRGICPDLPDVEKSAILTTTNASFFVEETLQYFVQHEQTKMLCIEFPNNSKFYIWKIEDGTYDVSVIKSTSTP